MKILIADDEPLARMRLRALVNELGGQEILEHEAENGKEAFELSKAYQPDVILLDIGMPGINGMEACKQLNTLPAPPVVIFITAYAEYALEAFEQHAVDYLLKPVRKERLQQALERAALLFSQPVTQITDATARTHISVSMHGELRLIPVDKIYYFRAEQKYVTLRWEEGEALLDDTLKKLEPEFEGQFLRIHRNALVALTQVSGMRKDREGQCHIKFQDIEDELEISRRHLQTVKQVIKDNWGRREGLS
jgi:two-component system response regulator AlgR